MCSHGAVIAMIVPCRRHLEILKISLIFDGCHFNPTDPYINLQMLTLKHAKNRNFHRVQFSSCEMYDGWVYEKFPITFNSAHKILLFRFYEKKNQFPVIYFVKSEESRGTWISRLNLYVAQFTGRSCKKSGLSCETCACSKSFLSIFLSLSLDIYIRRQYDGNSCLILNEIGSLSMIFTCSNPPFIPAHKLQSSSAAFWHSHTRHHHRLFVDFSLIAWAHIYETLESKIIHYHLVKCLKSFNLWKKFLF